MRDLAFYNGGDPRPGPRSVIMAPRRLLRRLLRPYFLRLEQILLALANEDDHARAEILRLRAENAGLAEKVDGLAARLARSEAIGWDQVAVARRLAAIEEALPGPRPAPREPSAIPAPHARPARASIDSSWIIGGGR
jgi:hypothetical protein